LKPIDCASSSFVPRKSERLSPCTVFVCFFCSGGIGDPLPPLLLSRGVSEVYRGCIQECIGSVSCMYLGCIRSLSVVYPGCIQGVSGVYPGCIQVLSRFCPGCIQGVFGGVFGVFWVSPGHIWGCIQGLYMVMVLPGCIQGVSILYLGCICMSIPPLLGR
jgi:hypothetical protein